MNKNKLKVILLVAGEGKRLRPHTLDKPKCMVQIDGISLIDRQMKILQAEGLDNILMIGGYKADMLKKQGVKLKINPRYQETNMVWTLFCAEEELIGDVVISYGDIVYSGEILRKLINSNSDISVTIDKDWEKYWSARTDNPLDDAETLKLSDDGKILEIGKKPESIDEIEGQYMGLMKFSSTGIEQIKKIFHEALKTGELLGNSLENSYMTDLLQAAINAGYSVQSIPVSGGWVEVDTVDDLQSPVTRDRVKAIK
jgi:L-glutamine-phosphate cytidylyltransferase